MTRQGRVDTTRCRLFRYFLLALSALIASAMAHGFAHAWPDRPVTLILPYPPGGTIDTQARIMGERLAVRLGQPIVMQNKPGATGAIATEFVTRAPPDGYTLLFGSSAQTTSVPMTDKVNYNPDALIPIRGSGNGRLMLATNAAVPARSLAAFIEYVKANPGKLSYASAGIASVAHLTGALFVARAKLDILHVPY